jgi:4-hydroxybenzoate polyprenyltransferase
MNPIKVFFQSNIYISLAAVSLTVETQIQLGMKPQWQPYLLFIFFAVFFEYNFHRLLSVMVNRETLTPVNHQLKGENQKKISFLVFASGAGLFGSAFFVKWETLVTYAPLALLTLMYSILIFGNKNDRFGFRKIPFLKIFLISFVWSTSTVILPVIQSPKNFDSFHTMLMFAERFFFILAIAIAFDIRDMEADRRAGLKTIPLQLNENKARTLSYLFLLVFFLIYFLHYQTSNDWFIIGALGISTMSTYLFIRLKTIRNLNWYYEGILDGTMFLQGVLMVVFFYFTHN